MAEGITNIEDSSNEFIAFPSGLDTPTDVFDHYGPNSINHTFCGGNVLIPDPFNGVTTLLDIKCGATDTSVFQTAINPATGQQFTRRNSGTGWTAWNDSSAHYVHNIVIYNSNVLTMVGFTLINSSGTGLRDFVSIRNELIRLMGGSWVMASGSWTDSNSPVIIQGIHINGNNIEIRGVRTSNNSSAVIILTPSTSLSFSDALYRIT